MADFLRFERELTELIKTDEDLRPFICEGNPLLCDVFIVGYNPATLTRRPFLSYWESGYGFKREEILSEIREVRSKMRTKAGRRIPEYSPSRATIHELIRVGQTVGEFRCLETNVYAAEAPHKDDVQAHQRVTRHFDFLLSWIQPKVIISHGKDANDYLRGKTLTAHWISIARHFCFRPYDEAGAAAMQAQKILKRHRG